MPYDPFKHPTGALRSHRRSIRLHGYDYTQAGAYFITIVTHNRECLFGDVVDGEMRVNALGQIVADCWDALPTHFPNVELDAFVVMPNHAHAIIVLTGRGEAFHRVSGKHDEMLRPYTTATASPHGTQSGSISAILQNFKSVSSRRINTSRNTSGAPVWHRNYYEHIIRNERSLNAIRKYIEDNPANWNHDEENPINPQRARIFPHPID